MNSFYLKTMLFVLALTVFSSINGRAGKIIEGIGSSTNGINASGRYEADFPGGGHFVSVFIHFNPPSTNIARISPFDQIVGETNGVLIVREGFNLGKYFLATNSFCGLIELKNADGNIIPLLKSGINSPEAYPVSYSLKQARIDLEASVGMGPPLPVALTGSDCGLCNFYLHKYFKIEKPGDYQLTVWPKIYKRSETNHDLVERIDLPPVTIPIKWTGNSTN